MHCNPVSQRRNDALLRDRGKRNEYSERRPQHGPFFSLGAPFSAIISQPTAMIKRRTGQDSANSASSLASSSSGRVSRPSWPCLIMAGQPQSLSPPPRFLFPCAGHAGRDAMFQPSRGLVLAVFDSALALTSGSLQAFPSLQPLFVAVDTTNAHASKSIHLSCSSSWSKLTLEPSSRPHRASFSADDVVMPRPEFSGLPCYVQLFCSSSLISSPAGLGPEASALKTISIPGLAESFAMVSCECWSCHQAR